VAVAAGVIYGFSLKATREEGKKTNTVSSSFRVESSLTHSTDTHTHSSQWGGFIAMRRVTYKVERSR